MAVTRMWIRWKNLELYPCTRNGHQSLTYKHNFVIDPMLSIKRQVGLEGNFFWIGIKLGYQLALIKAGTTSPMFGSDSTLTLIMRTWRYLRCQNWKFTISHSLKESSVLHWLVLICIICKTTVMTPLRVEGNYLKFSQKLTGFEVFVLSEPTSWKPESNQHITHYVLGSVRKLCDSTSPEEINFDLICFLW